jgi:hypothetical protein
MPMSTVTSCQAAHYCLLLPAIITIPIRQCSQLLATNNGLEPLSTVPCKTVTQT